VEINVFAYIFEGSQSSRNKTSLEQEFNAYTKSKNLDVTVNVELLIFDKPTDSYTNFKSLIVSLFKKSNNTYDIFYYDSLYSFIFGPYLLNLKDYLPKEFIGMYDPKIINETCTNQDSIVGLPVNISYEVLYSNKRLLSKYGKPIPKTWDELIETCKYIMAEENDPELICYNGLFDESEQGSFSLYEFIYSCRDSYNSTFPKPQDPSFIDSLNMLYKLKTEIASNDIFSSNENFTFEKLLKGKSIFINYWYVMEPLLSTIKKNYELSILPGLKDGISGSMTKGVNIGIKNNISSQKRDAALEILKYVTSKDYQREQFASGKTLTAISEFLDDDEMCKKSPCSLLKEIQSVGEPKFITDGPDDYAKRYKKYIYNFLYDNKTISETLKQIFDITKVYSISLDTENTSIGLISIIYFSIVSVLMLLSLIFLYIDNLNQYYLFLPKFYWIITILGSILLLWVPVVHLGSPDTVKCHLKPLLVVVGYTLSICPTLQRLIAQFPEDNKFSFWVINHNFSFLIIHLLIDVLINSISLTNPYTSKIVSIEDGENFETCKFNGEYSIIIVIAYKFLEIFLMLFLVFVEWNLLDTAYDMKFILLALYVDILCAIVIYIFHIIQVKNYITFYLIQIVATSLVSISNYMFLYGSRLLVIFLFKNKDEELEIIQKIKENFATSDDYSQSKSNKSNCVSSKERTINEENEVKSGSYKMNNFLSKMIDYHYSTESRHSFSDSVTSSRN